VSELFERAIAPALPDPDCDGQHPEGAVEDVHVRKALPPIRSRDPSMPLRIAPAPFRTPAYLSPTDSRTGRQTMTRSVTWPSSLRSAYPGDKSHSRNLSVRWGYAALVIVNLFAYRTRHPKLLASLPTADAAIGPAHDRALALFTASMRSHRRFLGKRRRTLGTISVCPRGADEPLLPTEERTP
jgi:hypothetical protein